MNITRTFAGIATWLAAASVFAVPVVLDITFDDFPSETSFGIWDMASDVDVSNLLDGFAYDVGASSPIGFGDGYVLPGDFTGVGAGPWQFVWDLAPGDYYFAIFDSFGDGICCGFGTGSYSLSVDGTEIFAGGEFDNVAPVDQNGNYAGAFTVAATLIAEPATLALLGLGMIGLAVARRRI